MKQAKKINLGNEESQVGDSWKNYVVAIPLFGSALAVTFDVGYFWGLDINLFSVFTLTEHLVFAMQALPAAILVAGMVTYIGWLSQIPIVKRWLGKARPFLFVAPLIGIVVILFVVTTDANWPNFVVMFIFFAAVFGSLAAFPQVLRPPNVYLLLLATAVFAVVFAFGIDVERMYISRAPASYFIELEDADTHEIRQASVALIRSGDRGALVYDPGLKRIRLLPWDSIKEISSRPHPISNSIIEK